MYWTFTVIIYANIGPGKMKIPCTIAVSLDVDILKGIIFSSLLSTLSFIIDLKKP